MNFKILALAVITVVFLWDLLLRILSYRSARNPMPENVKDIYNEEEFLRWQAYHRENSRLGFISVSVTFAVSFALVACNVFVPVSGWFGEGAFRSAVAVVLADTVISGIIGMVFSYVSTMKIEQKYGFNNTTMKTFLLDQLKSFLIGFGLTCGLLYLFVLIYETLGDWLVVVFTGVLMAVLLIANFLYPFFSKIFNKFTPLPDGELKERLTALLNKYGYKVRAIQVMDASRRTTKSNAYFTGFGKMKTIVLYDNLVNTMEPEEICAVFAHEMGHGLHKDTLKNTLSSFFMILLIVIAAWLMVRTPAVFRDFGFDGVNYGFALYLLGNVIIALISPLISLLRNAMSRRAEYRADAQAVRYGYGRQLISALKKLSKENFANLAPSPLLVKLEYSHPTLSMRIDAIEGQLSIFGGE